MKGSNKRYSNIELLRIVAMIMVVVYHINYHCVMNQLINGVSEFSKPNFYKQLFLIEGTMPFGSIANAIFILITGYFMIEKEFNVGKVFKKLSLQMAVALILMIIVSTLYYRYGTVPVGEAMVPLYITDYNSMNWFVGYYFAVIVVAAIFLNNYLNRLDNKKYIIVMAILLGIATFRWSGEVVESVADGLRVFICGLFLYAMGGYMKKYNPFKQIRMWALVAFIIILYVFIYVSYYNNVMSEIQYYYINGGEGAFTQPLLGFDNYGIVAVIISVLMLEIFRRLPIPSIKIINFLGASTFMIYLMHDNKFWWPIWNRKDWLKVLLDSPKLFCRDIFLWAMCMFAIGVISYIVYLSAGVLLRVLKRLAVKCEVE